MAEMHDCWRIKFWLIKKLFEFINSDIDVYFKNKHYFPNSYMYTCVCVCVCVRSRVMYECVCVCMYVYTCECVCVSVWK